MSDTPDASSLLSNSPERSVSELSTELKRLVEDAFGQVRLRGEISGYRGPHSSGHMYFTLKDERACIDAVVWRGTASKLKFPPEEGMEVSVTGKVTTYPGRSKYQIVIETLEPAGVGALMALLEERRRKLAAEGLFDDANKRTLPFMPGVIGVVTSPTGSVIRDIIHRIKDRFAVHVIVWPVRVQGESSASEVSAAIAGFNALSEQDPIPRPDLIIVARGGGSLEDLWGFNEEAVVRAAADSTIPIISAVGHETDWTLLDHVADRRAPTPTGAAEMAVPVRADLEAALASLVARHAGGLLRHLERQRTALRSMARGLPSVDTLLALPRRRFDEAASANGRALLASVGRKRDHFSRQAGQLSFAALTGRFAAARERTLRLGQGTDRAISRRLLDNRRQLTLVERRLDGGPARLEAKRSQLADRTGALENRLERAFGRQRERVFQRLGEADRLLQSLSHRRVLERGFALVRKQDHQPVTRARSLASGETITIEFADGTVGAVTKSGGKPAQPKRQDGDGSAKQQGSLF